MTTSDCLSCGNPVPIDIPVCPYCGGYERASAPKYVSRSVDVGHHKLTASEASSILLKEIEVVQRLGGGLLTVVHGYGSSGPGGRIRDSTREACRQLQGRRKIKMWIPGELLSPDTNIGRRFRQRFPAIVSDSNWNRQNEGVTVLLV